MPLDAGAEPRYCEARLNDIFRQRYSKQIIMESRDLLHYGACRIIGQVSTS